MKYSKLLMSAVFVLVLGGCSMLEEYATTLKLETYSMALPSLSAAIDMERIETVRKYLIIFWKDEDKINRLTNTDVLTYGRATKKAFALMLIFKIPLKTLDKHIKR